VRTLLRAVGLCALLVAGSGCESVASPGADGGVGRRLVILDPPGSQIGLRYGKPVDLQVRYLRDDAAATPISGEPVRFAIFDDPVGSTLARDVVTTDDAGLATVTLTAGSQEGSFHVRASASGADDAEFAIAISQLDFVQLDPELTDPLPLPGGRTLVAALYQELPCAQISPTPKVTGADRTLVAPGVSSTHLSFVNLLSRSYAVVGRVEAMGGLVAFGCVDVDRALVPPGARLVVPVVMHAVQASVVGGFDLDTEAGSSRASRTDSLFADVDVLDRCVAHLGQLLLDELAARVAPLRASQIAALRGPATPSTVGSSTVACRPGKLGAVDSLDAELGALVSATGSPGEARTDLIADLDAILQSAHLRSHLELTGTTPPLTDGPGAPPRYAASHQARVVTLTLGMSTRTDDLLKLGVPVLGADGIGAHAAADELLIDTHELPIGLPALWGDALSALSIAIRLPALPKQTLGGWASAAALAAQRSGKSGCAAIEDLICQRTDPTGCAGTLLTACANAVAAVAARMDAPFSPSLALTLTGSATIVDTDDDLVADKLDPGRWTAAGAIAGQLSFTGPRSAP
jgi:hypothetical protein